MCRETEAAIARVKRAEEWVARIEADIAYAMRWNHGRGAADDRVGLHFANVELIEAKAAVEAIVNGFDVSPFVDESQPVPCDDENHGNTY